MNPDCFRIHKYSVATAKGISEALHTEGEALAYFRSKERVEQPEIVAFHSIPIQHLIDHPDTIEIYCEVQTRSIEAELRKSITRVDFVKRS